MNKLWVFILCAACCGAQESQYSVEILSHETVEQLQQQYDQQSKLLWSTIDLNTIKVLNENIKNLGDEITNRDDAILTRNTSDFNKLIPILQQVTKEKMEQARGKWCHQTLWRLLTGYKKPNWCY